MGTEDNRGIRGERGPRGDHGQHGDKGDTGATGQNAPNLTLREQGRALWSRPSVLIILGACLLIGVVLIIFYSQLQSGIDDINRERKERINQACLGYEAQHFEEVKELKRTYKIYLDPPPELNALINNPVLLEGLKDQIQAAQNDQDQFGVFVPPYCDEKNVGRPEPDPKVPETPQVIKDLLSSTNGKEAPQPK